jgi:hypothetical protein
MEINMKKNGLKNNYSDFNTKQKEILINKFIEKFPKVKLHTIIRVNKYLNDNMFENSNQIDLKVQEYLLN